MSIVLLSTVGSYHAVTSPQLSKTMLFNLRRVRYSVDDGLDRVVGIRRAVLGGLADENTAQKKPMMMHPTMFQPSALYISTIDTETVPPATSAILFMRSLPRSQARRFLTYKRTLNCLTTDDLQLFCCCLQLSCVPSTDYGGQEKRGGVPIVPE